MAEVEGQAERLTDDQIKALGELLIDTSANVYTKALSRFTVEFQEEDFDRLRNLPGRMGIFRCEECERWQGIREASAPGSDLCETCADGDGDDDDDDD